MNKIAKIIQRIFPPDNKGGNILRVLFLVVLAVVLVRMFTVPSVNTTPYNGEKQTPAQTAAQAKAAKTNSAALESEQGRQSAESSRGLDYTYTDLKDSIARGQVAFATLKPSEFSVIVELKDGSKHTLNYPPNEDNTIADDLANAGASVEISNKVSRSFTDYLIPIMLFGVLGFFIFSIISSRRAMNGGPAGKAAQLGDKTAEVPQVKFTDVAGVDEAVSEVGEMVDFLKHPSKYLNLGAKMPSGVILYGPPGTGKTLLAKAVAGEAGVPFLAVSGSDFVQMYVGVGAMRVRELFEEARKHPAAVIFIDEIDAVGKTRGGGGGHGSNDEREQTLNQLLVELDGFQGRSNLVVIAATNRLDTLDPALLRPGRLTRHVHVGVPAEDGRLEILKVHSKSKPLDDDVNLATLAASTSGASGADLANMLNEGALMAARDGASSIRHEHLWEGFLRAIAGPRKASNMLAEGEKESIAYHEAGHALCAELCESVDNAIHVTINPRGQAAGFAVMGQSDRSLHSEQHIHEKLIYILGGRAAEYLINGTVSSGAANDLQQANAIARRAVEEYGLSEKVGQFIRGPHGLSEEMRAVADSEVQRLVEDAYRDAISMVTEHREQLDNIANALLSAGDIDRLEIVAAMNGAKATQRKPKMHVAPKPVEVPVENEVAPVDLGKTAKQAKHKGGILARHAAAAIKELKDAAKDAAGPGPDNQPSPKA